MNNKNSENRATGKINTNNKEEKFMKVSNTADILNDIRKENQAYAALRCIEAETRCYGLLAKSDKDILLARRKSIDTYCKDIGDACESICNASLKLDMEAKEIRYLLEPMLEQSPEGSVGAVFSTITNFTAVKEHELNADVLRRLVEFAKKCSDEQNSQIDLNILLGVMPKDAYSDIPEILEEEVLEFLAG